MQIKFSIKKYKNIVLIGELAVNILEIKFKGQSTDKLYNIYCNTNNIIFCICYSSKSNQQRDKSKEKFK